MATYQNQTYANQNLDVDGNRYAGCTFINCTLTYGGGELPLFENCVFRGGSIQLTDAAAQTVRYLGGLHRGGLADEVDGVLNEVARGNPELAVRPSPPPAEYEGTNFGQLGRVAAVLTVVTVLLAAAIWYGYLYYPANVGLDPARAQPLSSQVDFRIMPSHPEDLVEAYNQLTAAQQERVNSYGWVDAQRGIARIPVQAAFRMIGERGMPEWSAEGE